MDIYNLLSSFWQLRRSKRITSLQADLYYFLVQECNAKRWENPFECSNKLICASIGISEPSLIEARNRLKLYGLIDFKNGNRNEKSPVYLLLNLNSLSRNRAKPLVESLVNPLDESITFNKTIQDNTKQDNTSASNEAGADEDFFSPNNKEEERKKNSAQKKKEGTDITPHWQPLVAAWTAFYKEKYNEQPTFNGAAAKGLKSIADRLCRMAAEKGYAWDEGYAQTVFNHFLIKAHSDSWRQKNFLLHILAAHFDAIIQHDENATNNGNGGNHKGSVVSAFSKIDAMPD